MVKKPILPYTWTHSRTGIVYFRRGGGSVSLGRPEDPEFLARYEAARRGKPPAPTGTTIADLVVSYGQSSRWEGLSPRSKADYRKVLDYLRDKVGSRDVSRLTRPLVIEAMEANRHRARFANYIAQLASILCEHAVDLGWIKDNPVKGTKHLALGDGWGAWPAKALDAYFAVATGDAALLGELALGTGQRKGDILKMRWDEIEDNGIWVKQGKTGTKLWVPFTARLTAFLAKTPRKGMTILAGEHGLPLTERQVDYAFQQARAESGTTAWKIHGWRANRASELYEDGCTDAQVQAITGHRTAAQAQKYGRGASQKRLAKEAMSKRTNGE